MKKVKVEVYKFEAEDGTIFDNINDCKIYDKKLRGEARTCENCKGTKEVDPYGDGRSFTTCGSCGGKGYQEKHIIWK